MNKLGFGLLRLPLLNPEDPTSVDLDLVCKMVDHFLASGYRYFDTAYMYHGNLSEVFARKAIVERHPRESFSLTTKMPTWFLKEEGDLDRYFNEQLEKCGVDYFDYYFMHSMDGNRYELAKKFKAFEYIYGKKLEGKTRHTGMSYHGTAEDLEKILKGHGDMIDVVQIQLNYLDWDNERIQSGALYEICRKYGKKVIVMEPIKGGTLATLSEDKMDILRKVDPERSAPAWALGFAASQENVCMVLSGMSDLNQVEQNCQMMHDFEGMSEAEYAALRDVAQAIKKDTAIPCTACRYCVDGCPQKIAIPDYFKLYNDQKRDDWQSRAESRFAAFAKTHALPSECLACGQCESSCPQHLPIIENLKKVVECFE